MDLASPLDQTAHSTSLSLIRKRSPLPSVFRVWHVIFCVVCLCFLLSVVLWKAFQLHDVAVALQQDRLGQAAIQTVREPIARMLQQIETVGEHARSLAVTYRRLSESAVNETTGEKEMIRGVCEAPPSGLGVCYPPLEKFLGAVGPYPQSLYFIRYAYVSAATPRSWFYNATNSSSSASPYYKGVNVSQVLHCSNETALFPVISSQQGQSTASSSSPAEILQQQATLHAPYVWYECGCDLVEGCYYVDDSSTRQMFNTRTGRQTSFAIAQDFSGLDYIDFIQNLSKTGDARGEWNNPAEYQNTYAADPASTQELLLQFSVPVKFDKTTGKCVAAASIDISTEFIASALQVELAMNATLFIVDRRGPTLLGQSSTVAANRVVRYKFNPLLPTLPAVASADVRRLMPLFRTWIGGSDSSYLPMNETSIQLPDFSLAITPIGDHWVLFQAIGASAFSNADAYEFMKNGRLYLPVIVAAVVMFAILLIEFVHGTFPSAEWRFDDEDEDKRRNTLQNRISLKRGENEKNKKALAAVAPTPTSNAFKAFDPDGAGL